MKRFKNYKTFEKFLRKGWKEWEIDKVKINWVVYTMDYYDMSWKLMQRQNKKEKIWLEAQSNNRYKNKKDIEVYPFISYCFRHDINYIE